MIIHSLTKEEIIFTNDVVAEIGANVIITIALPKETILEKLSFQCKISYCEEVIPGEIFYVAGILEMPEHFQFIFNAYIQYLERELQIDANLGIESILQSLQQANKSFWKNTGIAEYLRAKIDGSTFH
jgi:hypothetical protein